MLVISSTGVYTTTASCVEEAVLLKLVFDGLWVNGMKVTCFFGVSEETNQREGNIKNI
jgi:hypothetical protein